MQVTIIHEALHDIALGADFYESISLGLGAYFADRILLEIESLDRYAGIHSVVLGLHRCISRRFPFGIFYAIKDDAVIVYAVLDLRQSPEKLDIRLADIQRSRGATEE